MKKLLIIGLILIYGLFIGCSDKFYEMRKSPCACIDDTGIQKG